MTPPLGYYVHHHGRGHAHRAAAVLEELRTPATVLTSVQDIDVPKGTGLERLPLDVPAEGEPRLDLPETPALHYAPGAVPGQRDRAARLVDWVARAAPAVLVVDVSVEVATLSRLAGVPTAIVRQHGQRTDLPHEQAYRSASALLAPWPEWFERPEEPDWMLERTVHTGGFCRFAGRPRDRRAARDRLGIAHDEHVAVLLNGAGGHRFGPDDLVHTAAATPGWRWIALGLEGPSRHDVTFTGWIDDPFPYLVASDVVVGTAGHNTVMEVATAGRPLIAFPQDRPFREQHVKAELLQGHDLATVRSRWPAPDAWPALLDQARERGGHGLSRLVSPDGAAATAAHLDGLVDRLVREAA